MPRRWTDGRTWGKLFSSQAHGAPVAQLDRASGYEPEGREFESPRAHHSPILAWKNTSAIDSIARMFNLLFVLLSLAGAMPANDLPTKKYLDLAAIKTMVAAAEAEAKKRNVGVTICIVDDSGNLLFLQKGDTASMNTIEFAQKKARHAALYKSASKDGVDAVKKGSVEALAFPSFFRTRRTADYRGRPD